MIDESLLATCRSKKRFRTKAEAKRFEQLCARKYGRKRHRPYRCRCCEQWHLTSRNLKNLRAAQRDGERDVTEAMLRCKRSG